MMHQTSSSRTLQLATQLIGSGTGCYVMSHLITGKSMLFLSLLLFVILTLTKSSGAPSDTPTIVSRLVTAEYWQRQCELFFPTVNGYTYGSAKGATANTVNSFTRGWNNVDSTRMTWTNGYVVISLITCELTRIIVNLTPGELLASHLNTVLEGRSLQQLNILSISFLGDFIAPI